MKKRWKLGLLLAALTVFMLQMTVMAAGEPVTPYFCWIAGDQVNVITVGTAPSDDGHYYLFALKTYETGVGNRTDYCATAPVGQVAQFTTSLDLNTASSKLYSRFVVTVRQGGVYVPVSSGIYITNPEVVATASTTSIAEATGNMKGIFAERSQAADITALGAGYVVNEFDLSYLLNPLSSTDVFPYEYNGKVFAFSAYELGLIDWRIQTFNSCNADVVMMLTNSNAKGGGSQDLVYPAALTGSAHPSHYAFNVSSQAGEEKLEAVISFLAERYNGGPGSMGSVHHFVIGNEVNSSDTWHYAGDISVDEFCKEYAKQFRICYNAIKSHNAGAKVYTCIDQCWTHKNAGKGAYTAKSFMDGFNKEIKGSGNINWCMSFHPYSVPLSHTKFWTVKKGYEFVKPTYNENTKMLTPLNMNVVTDYLSKPEFLAPGDSVNALTPGGIRDIVISELGFNASSASADTNENIQAAAMVYAYKLAAANPHIKAIWINSVQDNPGEITQGLALGLKRLDGTQRPAYAAYIQMDKGNTDYLLPYIGIKNWP